MWHEPMQLRKAAWGNAKVMRSGSVPGPGTTLHKSAGIHNMFASIADDAELVLSLSSQCETGARLKLRLPFFVEK